MISGVYYQGDISISWRADKPPLAATLVEWMHANAVALRVLASMEIPLPVRETESGNDVEKRLSRVEAKLDLTLNLLSRLLAQQMQKPEVCPVTLSASMIEWVSNDTIPPKGDIIISLFIDPRLPQPLLLPASIREIEEAAKGMRIIADFTHLSEEVEEELERTVFRNHRRHIQSLHGSGKN